jgi:Bacterial protein of unknown function (DUF899)
MPMVKLDPATKLIGADWPAPLTEVFDDRSQLIAHFLMWHTGRPATEQCEGCTFNTARINELSYLNARDVSYATFCEGPYEESSRYRDFMGWAGGTRCHRTPWTRWSQSRTPASWSAVSELVTGSTRPIGPPPAARADGLLYLLMDLTVYGRWESGRTRPRGGRSTGVPAVAR